MSVNLTKEELLVYFTKIDKYNYKCKTCNKVYKTPNGGTGNLKTHFSTHLKAPKDKIFPGKRISQSLITVYEDKDNEDDPQRQDIATVS